MSFVVDAFVALSWCFPDERTTVSHAMLQMAKAQQVHVPAIFPTEVGNGLGIAFRKGRITEAQVEDAIHTLRLLRIEIEEPTGFGRLQPILDHMQAHRLSGYDASYLELADRSALPLATFDRDLAQASRTIDIQLIHGSV